MNDENQIDHFKELFKPHGFEDGKPIWFVWRSGPKLGRRPAFAHHDKEAAIAEAHRLSALMRGDPFVVLEVVAKIQVSPQATA